jgi:dipeptidyl aminopeptidase/acylaminoacyl peptidase
MIRSALGVAAVAFASLAPFQVARLTADDYARAERFLPANTVPLVRNSIGLPTWLPDGRFWYRTTRPTGAVEFVVIDPLERTRTAAPDLAKLGIDKGKAAPAGAAAPPNSVTSPDGRYAAFIRDFNLWVKDLTTSQDRALTTDGVKDFGYATNNAGWIKSDEPVLRWSPDSKKIATFQHDGRGVSEMYLVSTTAGPPRLEAWKYPLPQDKEIFRIHRVVIEVEPARVVRLLMPPDQHRSTISDHVAEGSKFLDVEWYPDSSHVAFVSSSRDHKQATLRVAQSGTGEVRTVMEERVGTQFQSGFAGVGDVNWHVLPASREVLWWSQRDDWGHLYLYDLTTGALKRQVTTGNWNVAEVIRVDEKTRTVYVTGVGRETGRDPYFTHLYRVRLDTPEITLLTPEDALHGIMASPSGTSFVDVYSTPVTPPVSVLRDLNGTVIMELERVDISKLVEAGWKPPTPITVKARDGKTDLYGLMFTPTKLDPSRKYPIVNYIYPGPWGSSVGPRAFFPARGDNQALAELGFIVVAIDGMGTEWRSKSFADFYFGSMGDNTLPDQIAGMRELAKRFPYIDLDRAGIWGHSGGGFAAAAAMFRHPDFFKVGISESGNHDNRLYEDDWGERFQGLLKRTGEKADNYDSQANQLVAANLKGKLLLAHGAMDDNVPVYNTYLVVDALVKANKDFDLIILPHQRHGFGADSNYMTRRRWDYFVKHLLGAEPPAEYQIGRPK